MANEHYSHINQLVFGKDKKEQSPSVEEWKRHSLAEIERFLTALTSGFTLKRFNEYDGQGKYVTELEKEGEKVVLANESYPWEPKLGPSEENNIRTLTVYLQGLKSEIDNKNKELPTHLL